MQDQRSIGLCFNCDDKFSTPHRCQWKLFLLLLLDEEVVPEPTTLHQLDSILLDIRVDYNYDCLIDTRSPSSEHFQLSQAILLDPSLPKTL